jgi:hypothetical protein
MIISSALLIAASIIPVMVIDSGYVPHPEITNHVIVDRHSSFTLHGTIVTKLATQDTCPQVVVYICSIEYRATPDIVVACLDKAVDLKVKYINMSFNGGETPDFREKVRLKKLTDNNVSIIASSGNQKLNLDNHKRYPHSWAKELLGFYLVGAYDVSSANTGSNVLTNYSGIVEHDGVAYKGTSFSAPRYLNKLLKRDCDEIN